MLFMNRISVSYPCLMTSITLICATLSAGQIPKGMPTTVEIPKAKRITEALVSGYKDKSLRII